MSAVIGRPPAPFDENAVALWNSDHADAQITREMWADKPTRKQVMNYYRSKTQPRKKKPKIDQTFVCQEENCGETFKSKAGLNGHVDSVHKGAFKCPKCDIPQGKQKRLDAHVLVCTNEGGRTFGELLTFPDNLDDPFYRTIERREHLAEAVAWLKAAKPGMYAPKQKKELRKCLKELRDVVNKHLRKGPDGVNLHEQDPFDAAEVDAAIVKHEVPESVQEAVRQRLLKKLYMGEPLPADWTDEHKTHYKQLRKVLCGARDNKIFKRKLDAGDEDAIARAKKRKEAESRHYKQKWQEILDWKQNDPERYRRYREKENTRGRQRYATKPRSVHLAIERDYCQRNREKIRARSRRNFLKSVNARYSAYVRRIKASTDRPLTKEEFAKHASAGYCFYCGEESDNLVGLDRIDNNIGYESDNVLPCCRTCNFMKKNKSIRTFVRCCNHIATFQEAIQSDLTPNLFYAARTNSQLKFYPPDVHFLMKMPCYYCGLSIAGGVDRLDSQQGHTVDNCVPSCATCNLMKCQMPPDVFVRQCVLVANTMGRLPSVNSILRDEITRFEEMLSNVSSNNRQADNEEEIRDDEDDRKFLYWMEYGRKSFISQGITGKPFPDLTFNPSHDGRRWCVNTEDEEIPENEVETLVCGDCGAFFSSNLDLRLHRKLRKCDDEELLLEKEEEEQMANEEDSSEEETFIHDNDE